MTQAQAAARLGISQARLSELENSPGRLSVERLLVLVNALGLELVLRSPVEKAAPHIEWLSMGRHYQSHAMNSPD